MPNADTLYTIAAGALIGGWLGYFAAMFMVSIGQGKREDAKEIRPYGRDVD